MKSYDELFDQRGSAYDHAMQRFPEARRQEFEQAVARAGIVPGMVVADVPAGGGYLRRYLPSGCMCLGHEPCASFTNHRTAAANAAPPPLLPLPWRDESIDVAITLAGIHHIADKRPLFAELRRVVRPGGTLVVSDVASGSSVARFLDGFVGDHNSTGHDGMYLDERTLRELRAARWRVRSCETVDFHWVFDDRQCMAAFCHDLFDVCRAGIAGTLRAIETQLGADDLSDGRVGMRWSLMTIAAWK